MIKNLTISEGRNPVDVALQEYGKPESIVSLMLGNGLSLADEITAGQILIIDTTLIQKKDTVSFYINKKLVVNTGAFKEIGNNQFLLQSGAGLLFQSGSKFIFQ